jgi:hypothetical protein
MVQRSTFSRIRISKQDTRLRGASLERRRGVSNRAQRRRIDPMRRHVARVITLVSAVMLFDGCRFHATPVRSALAVANEVDQAELAASGASSVYEALMRTRGLFFRQRGVSSLQATPMDAVLVFRSGALMGTIETLQTLRPADVRLVRRLSPMETYHKYGRRVSVAGIEVELVTL